MNLGGGPKMGPGGPPNNGTPHQVCLLKILRNRKRGMLFSVFPNVPRHQHYFLNSIPETFLITHEKA
jgi:hypothetical protein